jgi:hypothetical protein
MSLRIGYVNVRGLSSAKWEACNLLLNARFDFLFVAETWFVNHPIWLRDRRVITSTTSPPKNLKERQQGGIYLLGTLQTRGRVSEVTETQHSITFRVGQHIVSGVYFPPSLDLHLLPSLLADLAPSTILLGDINTRFRDPIHQDGEPGPPDRLQVWTDFMTIARYQHLKPQPGMQKLTTDHCFLRNKLAATLELVDNKNVCKIDTDHKYTLSLIIGKRKHPSPPDPGIKRFRTSQLSKPNILDVVRKIINQADPPYSEEDNLEEMNAKLVQFCQHVQEQTIGLSPQPGHQMRQPRAPSAREQTISASIQLYKHANRSSD